MLWQSKDIWRFVQKRSLTNIPSEGPCKKKKVCPEAVKKENVKYLGKCKQTSVV